MRPPLEKVCLACGFCVGVIHEITPKPCCRFEMKVIAMKERILDALSQSALEGKTVIQLQIFSHQARCAITSSAEFFRGAFLGIPVVFLSAEKFAVEDFALIFKD